ncbi:MAG: 4-phosphoerythronate dehydrogenase [Prevotellaceae bacterium]|jgi:erythronate-4-phosphate dehydrogenase|nr:4-phosphoerythronate dehydrogenase [Prevotellaceae bacterium]
MKIVIDKNIPYIQNIFEECAEVNYLPSQEIDNEAVKDADALIIRTRTICNETLLHGAKVSFIATATAGTDHIDFDYCKKNNIKVFSAAGCNASSVAQYVGSAMAVYFLPPPPSKIEGESGASQIYTNFEIPHTPPPVKEGVGERTIGIVGWGHVGKEVEKLCNALGFKVLRNDPPLATQTQPSLLKMEKDKFQICTNCEIPHTPPPLLEGVGGRFVSLDEICENADIITFHTPLTFSGEFATKNLADEAFFQKLKRKPLIINAARGGIVNEKALLNSFYDKKISDFVLDCWENEPNVSPEIAAKSLIATPHIAGYSADGKANATRMCIEAVSDFFKLNLNFSKVLNVEKVCVDYKGEKLLKYLLQNYNIMQDSANFKGNINNFEFFRNNYWERREISF